MKRTVLITGGSRGIGASMVQAFKSAGDTVLTCATSIESLRDSKADHVFACDVSNEHCVRTEIARIIQTYGSLDVLICNAGIAPTNSLSPDSTDELWHRIIDTNLNGSYYFSKLCAPHLKDRTGRMLHIGSISSFHGSDRLSAYAVSKHAILGLTRSFARLLAPRGITVNAICPGFVDTEMTDGYLQETGMTKSELASRTPLKHLISPEEVADLALFLSSHNSCSITGQSISIDAGLQL